MLEHSEGTKDGHCCNQCALSGGLGHGRYCERHPKIKEERSVTPPEEEKHQGPGRSRSQKRPRPIRGRPPQDLSANSMKDRVKKEDGEEREREGESSEDSRDKDDGDKDNCHWAGNLVKQVEEAMGTSLRTRTPGQPFLEPYITAILNEWPEQKQCIHYSEQLEDS